jgi:hypothetical protein
MKKCIHLSGLEIATISLPYRGEFPLGVKRQSREADHSLLTSAEDKKIVGLYIHSPILLHGVVLNLLRSGTSLFTALGAMLGWYGDQATEKSLDFRRGNGGSFIPKFQTGCEMHSVSCLMGSWGTFPGDTLTGEQSVTTHRHMRTTRTSSRISSAICVQKMDLRSWFA